MSCKEVLHHVICNVISLERDRPAHWKSAWRDRLDSELRALSRPHSNTPASLEYSFYHCCLPVPRLVPAAGNGSARALPPAGGTRREVGFRRLRAVLVGRAAGGVAFANVQVTIYPYLAQSAPKLLPSGGTGPDAGFLLWILGPTLLLGIGAILLGIGTRRAQVFPRWTGTLLIISGVLFLLSIPPIPSPFGDIIDLASNVAYFVVLAWCGYLLMPQKQEWAARVCRLFQSCPLLLSPRSTAYYVE